jgi:hypothetical protein
MPDNVGYTPGSGATVAADEISGVLHQRVKIGVGEDGVAQDVSLTNPMPIQALGELIEAIEAMRMAIQSMNRTIGMAQVEALTGRLRVAVESIVAISGTITANQGGTWNITNLATIGGVAANSQVQSFERMTADNLRRNINVT